MRQTLKRLAIQALGVASIFPTALTDRSKLATLIHNLHPISPGMELIRLGPAGDGGYLVPNDLAGIEACFSPGVSGISGFEKDCADFGMQVFLADKSVDKPAVPHDRFCFTKKYVGATTSDSFMTMDDWVDSSLPRSHSDLLLQIDIEGYEYETFLSMSNSLLLRFRIIVAEFHRLGYLWSQPFFNLASPVFEKILQKHTCIHIHPNNGDGHVIKYGIDIPNSMEFTFLRSERARHPSFATVFPHPLDSDNIGSSSLPLPKCWYRK
ncbi:MAG: hypothetical protein NTX50_22845 [Candidatus Sumerlaeota bacterium]|nr:hypothetical protein [Candidatus Sumerlaeota bacterium]